MGNINFLKSHYKSIFVEDFFHDLKNFDINLFIVHFSSPALYVEVSQLRIYKI